MIPIIRATVENGGVAEMTVTGNSMKPLLLDRVSSVRLAKPDELRIGDIVLFERESGVYVLHRIAGIKDGVYDMLGDNLSTHERGISRESIIAKVQEYNRKGERWQKNDAAYYAVLPAVRAVRLGGRRIKRLFRRRRKME